MNCRSPWNKKTFPTGIEPAHTASEADALSTELRELHHEYTITVKIFQNISAKKPTWMRKSFALVHPGKTYFLTESTSYKRGLTSKATITCFHERVKPIGDKAQGYDAEQELTKWLTCEFSQCSIQSYSLFRIMLVRGHYQEDANDAEDHAQRSIPESTQIDHQLPHLCAQLSQVEP